METDIIRQFLASPHGIESAEFIIRINAESAKKVGPGVVTKIDPKVEKVAALCNSGIYKDWGGAMANLMGIYLGATIPFNNPKEKVPGSWPWENTFCSTFRVLQAYRDYATGDIVMQIDKDRCVTASGKLCDHAILAPAYMAIATPEETRKFITDLLAAHMSPNLKDYVKSHNSF